MAAYKKRRSKKLAPITLVILLIAIIIAAIWGVFGDSIMPDEEKQTSAPPPAVPDNGQIKIHFIDVGQADSILIMTPDGNMIVDAGTNSSEDELKLYLDNLGITTFKYAVFTHPHEDHIGGADMIMNNYTVENVVIPDATATTATYNRMLEAIETSDAGVIQAVSGESFLLEALKCTVIAPNSPQEEYSSLNDSSVVLKCEYGNTSFMLTGDAEEDSEEEILEKYDASMLKCDLLKMGHHGSSTSSSQAFLDAVAPSVAVISCGVDNSYGHPHAETIEKLETANITYYRTDKLGSIVFVSDGETISLESTSNK